MKVCCVCKVEKPLTEFYMDRRRQRPMSTCKPCGTIKARDYRQRNPELEKRRYARERELVRERHLVRKYGVTLDLYDQMFRAQGGACAICRKKQD